MGRVIRKKPEPKAARKDPFYLKFNRKPVSWPELKAHFPKYAVSAKTACPLYRKGIDEARAEVLEGMAGFPSPNFLDNTVPAFAPDEFIDKLNECSQMEGEMLKAESQLTDAQRKVSPTAANPSYTVTLGKVSKAGESIIIKARSQKLAAKKALKDGWAPGAAPYDTASNIPGFEYVENLAAPNQSHGEARVLEAIFGPPLNLKDMTEAERAAYRVVFRVHWHGTKDPLRFHPCDECQKAIEAAKAAGLKIHFCEGEIGHD